MKVVIVMVGVFFATGAYAELQDPMKPANFARVAAVADEGDAAKQDTSLQLNSIIFSKGRKLAVINEQFAAEGEAINGAVIVKIMQTSVLVNQAGEELELHFASAKLTPVVKQVW